MQHPSLLEEPDPALVLDPDSVSVLGFPISPLNQDAVVERVVKWARNRESRVVHFCNAHVLVTARATPEFGAVIASGDLNLPDGAPVAYVLGLVLRRRQDRLAGPDMMLLLCKAFADAGIPIALYGSTKETLLALERRLQVLYPQLKIVKSISPPFEGPTTPSDNDLLALNESGARALFVGLGCPKQEFWMAASKPRVQFMMLGVGAAFDFVAGTKARAPIWMQRIGLEWCHRLASEPSRLWKRYLTSIPLFLWFVFIYRSRI
jgi:N-acetylglucosaminyldiphosphoundecaprenol N-acetyl-beta-D-mannosaminyltransferase